MEVSLPTPEATRDTFPAGTHLNVSFICHIEATCQAMVPPGSRLSSVEFGLDLVSLEPSLGWLANAHGSGYTIAGFFCPGSIRGPR